MALANSNNPALISGLLIVVDSTLGTGGRVVVVVVVAKVKLNKYLWNDTCESSMQVSKEAQTANWL